MRREPSDAERAALVAQCVTAGLGGFKFRRPFPVAGYIVDFICEGRVGGELDASSRRSSGGEVDAGGATVASWDSRVTVLE